MEDSGLTNGNGITREIVAKLWNLCNVLRDDGITYTDYVTELTFLLFLKMLAETGLVGGLVTLWALAVFLFRAFGSLRQHLERPSGWIQVGAALGCCGILVHSFVDFNLRIPANAVKVMQGEPKIYSSSENGRRHFCANCGTGLFYVNEQMLPGIIDVQSGTFDDPDVVPVMVHVQTAERLQWMEKAHELPTFERYPPQA